MSFSIFSSLKNMASSLSFDILAQAKSSNVAWRSMAAASSYGIKVVHAKGNSPGKNNMAFCVGSLEKRGWQLLELGVIVHALMNPNGSHILRILAQPDPE